MKILFINDDTEAIETDNLKVNNQSSLNSNNNDIVNILHSNIKIKSKRKNYKSPYKAKINLNPQIFDDKCIVARGRILKENTKLIINNIIEKFIKK